VTDWQKTWRGLQTPAGPDCPGDETLADLVAGRLEPVRRDALGDHIVGCRPCAPLVQDLMRVHAIAAPGAAKSRRPAVLLGLLAAAAVLVLAVVLPRQWNGSPGGPAPSLRGESRRGETISPANGAVLHEAPALLSWSVEDAAPGLRTRAALYDAELTLLWESGWSGEPSAEIPAEVRARLASPGTYFWRVYTSAGAQTRQSPLRRFDLAP